MSEIWEFIVEDRFNMIHLFVAGFIAAAVDEFMNRKK